jgi:pSer/pThr/pTyr-binding forkhead associated (FHA) protein
MAAKIILSMGGMVLKEYPLSKERMTIGRRHSNDIVIENLAVSGEHAVVLTILHDSFLEDLDSTNGLIVNGVATKKRFLQNNDLIEIGKHTLRYVTDHVSKVDAADFEKTMLMRAPVKIEHPVAKAGESTTGRFSQTQLMDEKSASASELLVKPAESATKPSPNEAGKPNEQTAQVKLGVVQILTGPNAGKELDLVKSLTTLGKPGVQVAVLARRPQGFFITHVEGSSFPLVNGHPLNEQPRQLNDHDLIDIAGVKMEFYFKN